MTFESSFTIAIAMLGDCLKNIAPVYKSMRRKPKTIRDLHARFFPRFEQVTWIATCTNLDCFIALFACAVIGRSNYFGICFTTLN